jgi:GNAT superfamily N-acetyltransferase
VVSTLRDGRAVQLRAATLDDFAALETLRRGGPRQRNLTDGHLTLAHAAAGEEPVGYAAWFDDCAFFCAVEDAFSGLGLGTLLLRNAAREAAAEGLKTLSVELVAGEHALAAMLRDCGLVSSWDLDHPVCRVELTLGARRPGWATP